MPFNENYNASIKEATLDEVHLRLKTQLAVSTAQSAFNRFLTRNTVAEGAASEFECHKRTVDRGLFNGQHSTNSIHGRYSMNTIHELEQCLLTTENDHALNSRGEKVAAAKKVIPKIVSELIGQMFRFRFILRPAAYFQRFPGLKLASIG